MTHISTEPVDPKILAQIQERLSAVLLGLPVSDSGATFCREFFTPTEQIMLAKRLSIIALLEQGSSSYEISKLLKVSTSTVHRLETALEKGEFASVVRYVRNKKNKTYISAILKAVVVVGTTPYGNSHKLYKRAFEGLDSA